MKCSIMTGGEVWRKIGHIECSDMTDGGACEHSDTPSVLSSEVVVYGGQNDT